MQHSEYGRDYVLFSSLLNQEMVRSVLRNGLHLGEYFRSYSGAVRKVAPKKRWNQNLRFVPSDLPKEANRAFYVHVHRERSLFALKEDFLEVERRFVTQQSISDFRQVRHVLPFVYRLGFLDCFNSPVVIW